jgi:2-dehydropantoate 2-reductase
MRYLIAGAGAIGAYIGARMALAGEDITLFARGPHLRAMQERGVRVKSPEGDLEAWPRIIASLEESDPFDVIFLCVKAHGLTQLAPLLRALIGENTTVVSTQNGVPWWYFQAAGGEFADLRMERVDPGRVVAGAIDPKHVVGSIIYFSTDIVEPGVVRHTEGNRISLGEPDGSRSERSRAIGDALNRAGLRCRVTANIRSEIWVKILGNVAFNPISALTGATLAQITAHADVLELVRRIMLEAEAVAARLAMELPISIEQRIAGAAKVGEHKTSMLQDLEMGRPMELEPIVGAVVEIGERLGIAMPHTRAVYSCTKLLGEIAAARRAVSVGV